MPKNRVRASVLAGAAWALFIGAEVRANTLSRSCIRNVLETVEEPQLLDLNEVVQDRTDFWNRVSGKTYLDPHLSDFALPVRLSPRRLRHAIGNLVVNASHAGTTQIRISASSITVGATSPILCYPSQPLPTGIYAVLSLTDNGCGISPDVLQDIFRPSFSTKGSGGTGAGLSNVLQFTRESHAYVAVESGLGIGTTFSLYFPIASDQ